MSQDLPDTWTENSKKLSFRERRAVEKQIDAYLAGRFTKGEIIPLKKTSFKLVTCGRGCLLLRFEKRND